MQIIDGYCNEPNIYADDIGEYNTAVWGTGDFVLPAGEQLGYELISNNEIKIKDGVFSTQGRRGVIKKGTTESCIIENGTQAEKRNDLIVIEYAKDSVTLIESHQLKVIKGTPGMSASDPNVKTGNIRGGAVLHQMPLYRVKLEGLNITAVEKLFTVGKISPETVDPMNASSEGLAADALKTKEAISSIETSFRDGCKLISAAITSAGVKTAENAAPDVMAANVLKVKEAGKNAALTIKTISGTCTNHAKEKFTGTDGSQISVLSLSASYSIKGTIHAIYCNCPNNSHKHPVLYCKAASAIPIFTASTATGWRPYRVISPAYVNNSGFRLPLYEDSGPGGYTFTYTVYYSEE